LDDREKAAAAWKRSVQMFPYSTSHQKLAQYYQQKQQTVARDRHFAKAALYSGMKAFREYKLPPAEQAIRLSLKFNPDDAQAWYFLAEIHLRLKNTPAAITAFKRCRAVDPYHSRAIQQLGRLTDRN
jgi:cytochrome c-type biogenesis protein CcmH/NrfG